MEKRKSKTLKGGNANDHLSNERTLLAWIRTSVGIMAFGFVVVKFALFMKQFALLIGKSTEIPTQDNSSLVGIAIVAVGAIVLILSYVKYKQTERQISMDTFEPSSRLVLSIIIAIFITSVLLILYLVQTKEIA